MAHAFSEDQIVEQPWIDKNTLEARGWVSFTLAPCCEADLRTQLLELTTLLGRPIATRPSGDLCDVLKPTESHVAKAHSLSKIYAAGAFPLHNDTAHWLTPCRYLMLACVFPGTGGRPTFLLDTQHLSLNSHSAQLLQSAPFRVLNGRNSFFSTIHSKTRPFIRFDPGCMTSASQGSSEVLGIFSADKWSANVEQIYWKVGTVLILDNWRVLHGRGHAKSPDPERRLLRVTIQ